MRARLLVPAAVCFALAAFAACAREGGGGKAAAPPDAPPPATRATICRALVAGLPSMADLESAVATLAAIEPGKPETYRGLGQLAATLEARAGRLALVSVVVAAELGPVRDGLVAGARDLAAAYEELAAAAAGDSRLDLLGPSRRAPEGARALVKAMKELRATCGL